MIADAQGVGHCCQRRGKAVAGARDGDVVLIAGKGHEKTQHIGDRVLAFDDGDVARAALARRARAR